MSLLKDTPRSSAASIPVHRQAEAYRTLGACLDTRCGRESSLNIYLVGNPLMTKLLRISLFVLVLCFVPGFAECYKPVTKNQLPSRIRTVAVPAFQMESQGLRYKVESRFTEAVMRELVHRGRGLRVQGQREGDDAVIEGVIKSFNFGGVLLDDKGRARIFEV